MLWRRQPREKSTRPVTVQNVPALLNAVKYNGFHFLQRNESEYKVVNTKTITRLASTLPRFVTEPYISMINGGQEDYRPTEF